MASADEHQRQFARIVARAWSDEEFKKRLLADPTGVFKEEGVDLPEGMQVKAFEDTPSTHHFVLPPKPDTLPSEDDLHAQLQQNVMLFKICVVF